MLEDKNFLVLSEPEIFDYWKHSCPHRTQTAICGTRVGGACNATISADGVLLASVPVEVFAGEYDRALPPDSVALVPTGSPGSYYVRYRLLASSGQSGPLDLGTIVTVTVNGSPVDSQAFSIIVAAAGGSCTCGGTCAGPNELCTGISWAWPPEPCGCSELVGGPAPLALSLNPGDKVGVSLRAAGGAAPEYFSMDNSVTRTLRALPISPGNPLLSVSAVLALGLVGALALLRRRRYGRA